jgi:hypothetical protein
VFTNQKWYRTVNTVEDLIVELKRLRKDMPVKFNTNQNNQSESVDVVLLNRDTEDVYVSFAEGGEWEKLLGYD